MSTEEKAKRTRNRKLDLTTITEQARNLPLEDKLQLCNEVKRMISEEQKLLEQKLQLIQGNGRAQ